MYNHLIDIFLAVAETSSFTGASKKLYISTTAIMKQINHLESILKVPLFARTARGVALTKNGEVFRQECQKLIDLSEEIIRKTRQGGET